MATHALRWSDLAWAKALKVLELAGDEEVFMFGLAAEDDPRLLVDVIVPQQDAGGAHADVEADVLQELMEDMADEGIEPKRWLRYWIHSHVGSGKPTPSTTDWSTLAESYGSSDWAAMIVLPNEAKWPSDGKCVVRYNQFVGATVDAEMCLNWVGLTPEQEAEIEAVFQEKVEMHKAFSRRGQSDLDSYRRWAERNKSVDDFNLADEYLLGEEILCINMYEEARWSRGVEQVALVETTSGLEYEVSLAELRDLLKDQDRPVTIVLADGTEVQADVPDDDDVAEMLKEADESDHVKAEVSI